MADFDDQLHQILSDPAAMARIMNLAQSLSGGTPGPGPPPPQGSAPADDGPVPDTPPPPQGSALLRRLLPLLQESRRDSDARAVLYALRPYLRPRRRENIERALQLARLYRLGKQFLWTREG